MLTLPNFIEKKIIFIGFGDLPNEIKFKNENICLYKNGEFVNQISCFLVFSVFIFGEFTLTSVLIRKLKRYGISVFMLSQNFDCYAQINSEAEGNFLLRAKQYQVKDKTTFILAKKIVKNKIKSQQFLLKQKNFKKILKTNEAFLAKIDLVNNNASLLGIEGQTSKNFFQAYFKNINWSRRAPRTKEDIPNLLLDIGYTFLFNYVDSLLRLFGFDVYKGFYHQNFFQRKSLSCDLMEPMRSIIDKKLLKTFNLKQIDESDFVFKNGSFSFKKWSNSRKYCHLFTEEIMENREEIYNFVLNYYRYFMNSDKYQFEEFNLC
jgi:CRISPR-associated protein Cas1